MQQAAQLVRQALETRGGRALINSLTSERCSLVAGSGLTTALLDRENTEPRFARATDWKSIIVEAIRVAEKRACRSKSVLPTSQEDIAQLTTAAVDQVFTQLTLEVAAFLDGNLVDARRRVQEVCLSAIINNLRVSPSAPKLVVNLRVDALHFLCFHLC